MNALLRHCTCEMNVYSIRCSFTWKAVACLDIVSVAIWLEPMSCVICLEDGAYFACERSRFHVDCLSNFLLRNGNRSECTICYLYRSRVVRLRPWWVR